MATSSNDSLRELERRAETTRAELAQTVDALHSRVSPAAIRADVRSYLRDNPLQAAAIAVGAAYPVWRMMAAMPAPILLIGAGLAMARRGHGNGSAMMASLRDKAADLTSQITETAQDTVENVRTMAADTAARTGDTLAGTLDSTRRAAADTLQQVSERASDGYARASEQIAGALERHPLLAGGVAFAVGSIVASAVPVTRPESRLMGETAEEVRRRSQEFARHGLDEARQVARQVYETAADQIRHEGLTPEAARQTARAAVESARGAMEDTTSRS